jgi:hypothetical protein
MRLFPRLRSENEASQPSIPIQSSLNAELAERAEEEAHFPRYRHCYPWKSSQLAMNLFRPNRFTGVRRERGEIN